MNFQNRVVTVICRGRKFLNIRSQKRNLCIYAHLNFLLSFKKGYKTVISPQLFARSEICENLKGVSDFSFNQSSSNHLTKKWHTLPLYSFSILRIWRLRNYFLHKFFIADPSVPIAIVPINKHRNFIFSWKDRIIGQKVPHFKL